MEKNAVIAPLSRARRHSPSSSASVSRAYSWRGIIEYSRSADRSRHVIAGAAGGNWIPAQCALSIKPLILLREGLTM